MAEFESKAFLGIGLRFPMETAVDGELALAAFEQDIREAIQIILGTAQGERVMRPDFGAGLHALAFEPLSTATIALAKHRVEEALITWEPRIDNITVDVTADPPQGRLLVEVHYRIRATNTFYNLVYPFYLVEGEAP